MKLASLGSIAHIQLGKMLSPRSKTGTASFPYLRNQNVQWQRFDLTNLASMDFSERERKKFELKPGDLLICEGGEPGRCAVWDGKLQECYYQKALHRVRPKQGVADADFLALWIRFQALTGAFEDQNSKTTIAHLPLVRLEQLPIPDISIDEQHEIAGKLKTQLAEVDKAREAADAQLRETSALIAAVYRKAFQQIAPVAMPTSMDVAPSGWRWRKLTDIAQLESGHTPSRSRPDWWGGGVSWVSLTEIRALDGTWVEETQIKTNAEGIANSSARILPLGTVCFSRTASVGFVTILAKPMATSQDFADWICGDELDPEYLMYALIGSRAELRAIATGATHKTIYMPELESFHLCAPDRSEQERIVAMLKEELHFAEQVRTEVEQQLRELRQLPKKILAKAFGN